MVDKTYNLIIKEEAYKSSFFSVIPTPGIQRAVLLLVDGNLKTADNQE